MACEERDRLTAQCDASLKRLRAALQVLEQPNIPDLAQLQELEETRLAYVAARVALDEHMREHGC